MENQNRSLKKEPKKIQIIEGLIGKYRENFQEKLPSGITPEMVDLFLGNDGLWYWHLRPEFIEDEKERNRYITERGQWQ